MPASSDKVDMQCQKIVNRVTGKFTALVKFYPLLSVAQASARAPALNSACAMDRCPRQQAAMNGERPSELRSDNKAGRAPRCPPREIRYSSTLSSPASQASKTALHEMPGLRRLGLCNESTRHREEES